jgi:hypothetical protein
MVDPTLLCQQHLLGEHYEIHKLVGCLRKNRSVAGYVEKDIVELQSIRKRHRALVREMFSRGMKHRSPLHYVPERHGGYVNVEESLIELGERCAACRERILERKRR